VNHRRSYSRADSASTRTRKMIIHREALEA
jgi:hypothetical protein